MALIEFNVSMIKKGKGCYLARANELLIVAGPATTQRGALKELKDALRDHIR
jgi:hypothetical protein